MPGIDENLTFYPLRMAVLTITDTRDEQSDRSGALLVERLTSAGHELAAKRIVADDVEAIRGAIQPWSTAIMSISSLRPGVVDFPRAMSRQRQSSRSSIVKWTASRSSFIRPAWKPWGSQHFSLVPSRVRPETPSFSACLARPARAVMDGIGCWHSNSTAVTGPVRWLARSRA